jgi:tetratricopeptide (TPR) repeat protein
MGQALHAAGRYAEAADKLRAFLALQPAQHNAVADVTERGENLAVARTLAQVLLSQGQPGPAAELARQAAASADSDADQSPDNLLLAERAIRHRTLLAEALWLDSGEPAAREAHVQLEHIDARLARLGEIPADNTAWHLRTLGEVLALRARLQPQAFQGADPACMVGLQAHAGHVARLDAQGCGLHSHELQVVLAVGLAHGDALLAQGQPAAAAQRWQAVVDRALPAATEGLHRAMQHLALALLRLGQPQPARPWVERLQASTWRHPDLADLQQRLVDAEQAERGPALVRAQ